MTRLSVRSARLHDMDAASLLTRLAQVIDAHDWTGLPALLHDDFTCRLVHQ